MLGCGDAPMLGCWDAGLLRCWDAGLLRYWDAPMLGCWDGGMLLCWDALMLGCSDARMLGCSDAGMVGCSDAGVLGCRVAPVLGCSDARMVSPLRCPHSLGCFPPLLLGSATSPHGAALLPLQGQFASASAADFWPFEVGFFAIFCLGWPFFPQRERCCAGCPSIDSQSSWTLILFHSMLAPYGSYGN